MGVRDVLFGRKKLSEPSEDRLFALTTAAVTLQTELGLVTAGAAAVAFKPQSSGEFRSAFDDIDKLIEAVAQQSGSQVERKSDEFGFDWIIVRDPGSRRPRRPPRTHWPPSSPRKGSEHSSSPPPSRLPAASTRCTGFTDSNAGHIGHSYRWEAKNETTQRNSS